MSARSYNNVICAYGPPFLEAHRGRWSQVAAHGRGHVPPKAPEAHKCEGATVGLGLVSLLPPQHVHLTSSLVVFHYFRRPRDLKLNNWKTSCNNDGGTSRRTCQRIKLAVSTVAFSLPRLLRHPELLTVVDDSLHGICARSATYRIVRLSAFPPR